MRLETSCQLGGHPWWAGFTLSLSGSCRAVFVLHGRLGQCLWCDRPFAAGTKSLVCITIGAIAAGERWTVLLFVIDSVHSIDGYHLSAESWRLWP